MADNDARRVIVVQADKDGYATALSINEALRQIVEMVYQQEGRRGPVTMRDGLTLNAPDRFTQLQIAGTPPFSNAALCMGGPQESSLFVAKGAYLNDNGVWIATDTVAVLLELSRTSTTPSVYCNTGLSIDQAFTPTLVGALSTGSIGTIAASTVTFSAGSGIAATNVQNAIVEVAGGMPFCKLSRSTDWTHSPTSTYQTLPVDTVEFDTDGIADIANNRMIIQTPGVYEVSAMIKYTVNITGCRIVAIYKNGNTLCWGTVPADPSAVFYGMPRLQEYFRLANGDILTCLGYQNSGGDLLVPSSFHRSWFAVKWVMP